jgi:hypothetical protein
MITYLADLQPGNRIVGHTVEKKRGRGRGGGGEKQELTRRGGANARYATTANSN